MINITPECEVYIPDFKQLKFYVTNAITDDPDKIQDEIFKLYFDNQLKRIEWAGRTAYKSEDRIGLDTSRTFVKNLIKRNHDACIEFGDLTVKFVCSRYITHEMVRHRIASYVQESTRYVAYDKERYGGQLTTIAPKEIVEDMEAFEDFVKLATEQEALYIKYREKGFSPQAARAYLPSELKTEICVKTNWREWKHIMNLRFHGKTGAPAPEFKRLLDPLYEILVKYAPEVFED